MVSLTQISEPIRLEGQDPYAPLTRRKPGQEPFHLESEDSDVTNSGSRLGEQVHFLVGSVVDEGEVNPDLTVYGRRALEFNGWRLGGNLDVKV